MSVCNKDEPLRVGVVGAKLEVQVWEWDEVTQTCVIVDISGATTLDIIVQRPDGTTFTRTATLTNTGTDGKMYIVTIGSDITMDDTYKIQGFVITPTWSGHSSIETFEAEDNLV